MSELISGKEALIALANGEEVEYIGRTKNWFPLNREVSSWNVSEVLNSSDVMDGTAYQFRLKPRTITINGMEVPAPFEPEEGELFYHASPEYEKGYSKSMACERNETTWQQFGAWRSEDEIKQVVAALRSIFNPSK